MDSLLSLWRKFPILLPQVPFYKLGVKRILHMISYPFPSVWHTLNDNYQALDFQTIEYLSKILRVFVYGYLNIWIANFIWIIISTILTDLSSWLYNVWPCSRKMSCVNIVSRLIKSSVNLTDLLAWCPVSDQCETRGPPTTNQGPVIFLTDPIQGYHQHCTVGRCFASFFVI